jgi:hypothetical protein
MNQFTVPDLSLTDAERERFNQAVQAAGLDVTTSWNNIISLTTSGEVPSGFITAVPVTSLSELKSMIGLSDDVVLGAGAAAVHPPAPAIASSNATFALLEPRDLAKALTLQQHRDLKRAANTFVFGHSATVADDSALIEALSFPTTINVIAAQSLALSDGVVLKLDGSPWVLILGSLVFGSGAQIVSSSETVINAQVAYSAN